MQPINHGSARWRNLPRDRMNSNPIRPSAYGSMRMGARSDCVPGRKKSAGNMVWHIKNHTSSPNGGAEGDGRAETSRWSNVRRVGKRISGLPSIIQVQTRSQPQQVWPSVRHRTVVQWLEVIRQIMFRRVRGAAVGRKTVLQLPTAVAMLP